MVEWRGQRLDTDLVALAVHLGLEVNVDKLILLGGPIAVRVTAASNDRQPSRTQIISDRTVLWHALVDDLVGAGICGVSKSF